MFAFFVDLHEYVHATFSKKINDETRMKMGNNTTRDTIYVQFSNIERIHGRDHDHDPCDKNHKVAIKKRFPPKKIKSGDLR